MAKKTRYLGFRVSRELEQFAKSQAKSKNLTLTEYLEQLLKREQQEG